MACVICEQSTRYLYNLARWLDQGLNMLTGGDPRQTVSSRLGRAEQAGKSWATALCRVIGFIARNPTHCTDAIHPGDNAMEVVDMDGKAQ